MPPRKEGESNKFTPLPTTQLSVVLACTDQTTCVRLVSSPLVNTANHGISEFNIPRRTASAYNLLGPRRATSASVSSQRSVSYGDNGNQTTGVPMWFRDIDSFSISLFFLFLMSVSSFYGYKIWKYSQWVINAQVMNNATTQRR